MRFGIANILVLGLDTFVHIVHTVHMIDKGAPSKAKQLTTMGIRLDGELLAKVQKLAEENDRTVGYVVRKAVEAYLEWVEREQGKSKPSA